MKAPARRTRAVQQFKESAFTSRMAGEARTRAWAAWKAALATGSHPEEIRRLEVQLAIATAREATAQDLEDEAWQDYLKSSRHG